MGTASGPSPMKSRTSLLKTAIRFSAFWLIFRGRFNGYGRDISRSCEAVFRDDGKQKVNDFPARDNAHCPSELANVR